MFPSNKRLNTHFKSETIVGSEKRVTSLRKQVSTWQRGHGLPGPSSYVKTLRIGLENFEKEAFRAARLISQRRLTLTYPADAKER